jgi:ABC-type glutathione transport system ATPase component
VTHQGALLEGVADEFIWMQAGQIVNRTARFEAQGVPVENA